ncbi:hypothetical protein [Pseudoalteromonas phenolica]|uniref:hypothetical protein n=1 Tax=Pseudoalteromonas phenolica TaxID=161398 RepID=UPI00384FF9BE
MISSKVKYLPFSLFLSLSGCTVVTYSVPETSPKANLTIKTLYKEPGNLWVNYYEGDMVGYECSSKRAISLANLNNISLVSAFADKGKHVQSVNLDIEAEKPFRIQMVYPFPTGIEGGNLKLEFCAPHVSFLPKSGMNYKIVHGFGGDVCNMEVFEIDQNNNDFPVQHKKLPICYNPAFMQHIHDPIRQNYLDNPHFYEQ